MKTFLAKENELRFKSHLHTFLILQTEGCESHLSNVKAKASSCMKAIKLAQVFVWSL